MKNLSSENDKIIIKGIPIKEMLKRSMEKRMDNNDDCYKYCYCRDCRCNGIKLGATTSKEIEI
jgi:hypothetical protein